jgi:hypothetical protein
MNSVRLPIVGRVAKPVVRTTRFVTLIAFVGWCTFLHSGCVGIDGGAIELSWSLRNTEGEGVAECATARVGEMRLFWDVENAAEGSTRYETFPCDPPRAATRFEIPPGTASIWLVPVCENGEPAADGTYEAPAPIVRSVIEGEVVTLNALLVVVRTTNCGTGAGQQPCICQ